MDLVVLLLGDVLGNILPQGLSRLRDNCPALNVVQENIRIFLFFLREGGKGLVQLRFGLMNGFCFCTLLIENFQVLFKAGVHVIRVDVSSINGGQIAVHRIGNVIVRVIFTAIRIRREQLFIAECQHFERSLVKVRMKFRFLICILVDDHNGLIPLEALHLGCFQIFVEGLEQVGKLFALCHIRRDLRKLFNACRHKQIFDLRIEGIQFFHVLVQFIYKQAKRFIAGILFYRICDIFLHRMRTAVILDGAKLFVIAKQSVGAGERLNQIFVLQHFIQIQGVDPLGVKACQHLIHHD